MDLTKGLRIKDNYMKWKNNYKKENEDKELKNKFYKAVYNEEKLNIVFNKYPKIKEIIDRLNENYLVNEEGYYIIGFNIVSKLRLLRNLCNYKGKGADIEVFEDVLKYNSNINNIDEVLNVIKLEKGDESVKLSKGL